MSTDKSTSLKSKLCVTCGKNKKTPGASRCRRCQDRVNARQRVLREQRKAAGLCKCGRAAPRDGKADCHICFTEMSQSQNVTYRNRKAAGLCPCGAKPDGGYKQCANCRELDRRKNEKRRKRVLAHYGEQCACCTEDTIEFLEIDHINGGGSDHRREIGAGGLYQWLINNKFPEGFQTLCSNCNRAKFRYGECPHQRNRKSEQLSAMSNTR